jgi:diaminopimelate decarboxylase
VCRPRRSTCTATPSPSSELPEALDAGIGDIVVDNFDDLDKLDRLVPEGRVQPVQLRITPDVAGDTHAAISTGQADSKFGFGLDEARVAIDRSPPPRISLTGLHAHIGSQLLALQPFRLAVAAMARSGTSRRSTSAAASASPTTAPRRRRASPTTRGPRSTPCTSTSART